MNEQCALRLLKAGASARATRVLRRAEARAEHVTEAHEVASIRLLRVDDREHQPFELTAELVARLLVDSIGDLGPLAALAVIYVTCLLFAEMLHHNAAVAIMFPIAVATADQVGADPRGFVMAVAVASCCAFASPVTYQTHLIVYGPGGYRFTDFIKAGAPLDVACAVVALTVIAWVWPF